MTISSRTPEGQPNHCPVCGASLALEPSGPARDAPCPRCGHLLWFTWEDAGDELLIRLRGKIIAADTMAGLVEAVASRHMQRIVLDFEEVQYMSSAALGKLIELTKRLRPTGKLILVNVQPDLLEVFRITRLDSVFDIEGA
jgi:anti-sigma B factor antagonist